MHQQATRLRGRREAETARAFFFATRYANGVKRNADGSIMKDARGHEVGYVAGDLAEVYPELSGG